MARSVTGLFRDQRHVDRIVGALIDAGFEATQITAAAPDGSVSGTGDREDTGAPTELGGGIGVWLARHLEGRGLAREHAVAIVLVTHDETEAKTADRVLRMDDGLLR